MTWPLTGAGVRVLPGAYDKLEANCFDQYDFPSLLRTGRTSQTKEMGDLSDRSE
jgi:hypothetical protein